MPNEKRRSDRLMLTISLRVHGVDSTGAEFKADGRTLVLNRHGARIQIDQAPLVGSTVRLVNKTNHREAEFRVVGPTAPRTGKSGEWGVEYVNPNEDIWGIRFPPMEGDVPDSTALLECRKCHVAALARLSLVEAEVLQTAGTLTRPCESCQSKTPWGYAEQQKALESTNLAEASAKVAVDGLDKRRHRRVALQLPVRVRDYEGGVEITKSGNVSRGGFCFVSEKNYVLGAGVMIQCPYSPGDQSPEVHARIVRQHRIEGTNRKVYGVRYE
jgi:hypothetical protein